MSYFQKNLSDRDRASFIKKYAKTGNINEAVILSNLYRLHLAFGGKKQSSDGSSLPGTKSFGFIRRNIIQSTFKTRIGEDNAILKSKESFPEGVKKADTDITQALSLYIAMNVRNSFSATNYHGSPTLGTLEPNSITARIEFKEFLDKLVRQGEGFQIPATLEFAGSLNMDEQAFAETWSRLLKYAYVVDGKETDGVQQFYTHLRLKGRIKGDLFGEAFTIDDSFFVSSASIENQRSIAQRSQRAIEKASLKQETAVFNEQFYLMSRMEELAKLNSTKHYRNFSYIRRFDPSSNLENSIYFEKSQDLLFNMTPIQLSALVPYFKLYLVHEIGEEREAVLMPLQGSHLNLKDILESKSTDKSVGFKSFDWSYQGSYLETANDIIDCSLKLFGGNLEALNSIVGRIEETDRNIKFEDLVTREAAISFRAICGWAVPYGVNDRIISKELRRALQKSLITLELGIPKFHNFDFQQDGRFELEIKYAGRISQELQNFNLLEDSQDKKKVALQPFDLQILTKFKKIATLDPNKKIVLTDREIDKFISDNFKDSPISKDLIKDKFLTLMQGERDLTKAINLTNRLLADKVRLVRTNDAFSKILKKIELQDRMFYFSLDRDEFDSYLKGVIGEKRRLRGLSTADQALARKAKEREKRDAKEKEKLGEVEFNKRQEEEDKRLDAVIAVAQKQILNPNLTDEQKKPFYTIIADAAAQKVGGLTVEESRQIQEKEKKEKETIARRKAKANVSESPVKELSQVGIPDLFDNKTLNEKIASIIQDEKQSPDENFYLPFFFFGDLVESILSIAGKERLDRKKLRILLGGLIYRNPSNNSKTKPNFVYIPLVDIPISIRNFSAFVHKTYIRKPVLNMDLNSFLTDSFNSLVKPIFSGRDAIFDLPDFAKRDTAVSRRFFTTDKKISHGLIDPVALKSAAIKSSQENFSDTINFALFNGNQNNYSQEQLNRAEDSQSGVMHLSLGQNSGLVKKASFSKHDLKFMRTGRLVADIAGNESIIDKIREPYDVYVEMYGNNVLMNGSRFFITPSMPGVSLKGETSKQRSSKSVASRLGLGGYYMVVSTENTISETGFFTNVQARFNDFADANEEAAQAFASGDSAAAAAAAAGNLSKQVIKK